MKNIKKLFSLILAMTVIFSSTPTYALYNAVKKQIKTLGRGWDIVEENELVYLADGVGGVQIIDISDRQNATTVNTVETGFDTRTVDVLNGVLYACGGSTMKTYNVKTPQNPVMIQQDSIGGSTKSNISNGKLGIFGGATSTIFDISVPTSPKKYVTISGYGNTLSGVIEDNIVCIFNTKKELYIYDISDGTSVKKLSVTTLEKTEYVQDMLIDGDYLYIADQKGLFVMNIAEPTAPSLVSVIEKNYKLQGLWLEGDELYCVCYNKPMLIFDVSDRNNVKLIKEVTGLPQIAYAVKKIGRYVLLGGMSGFSLMDSEFEFDMTKVPAIPSEEVLERDIKQTDNNNYPSDVFDDTINHWANEHIGKMNSLGYIDGVGNKLFNPESNITRAELLTIVVRMLTPVVERYKYRFTDVDELDWYSDYVETAYVFDLIPQEMIQNNRLNPKQPATREEMAAISVRLMNCLTDKVYVQSEFRFQDDKDISVWAKESVYTAYAAGIISGMGDGKYNPADSCTRAQVCKILADMHTMVNDEGDTFIAKEYDVLQNQPQDFTQVYAKPKVETEGIPYVFNVTDVVLPGEILNFHGEWLKDAQLYIASGTKYELTSEFRELEVINSDTAGQTLTCVVPEDMQPGTYTVFLKNQKGLSQPIPVNNARVNWIDQEEVEQGGTLRILGRNLVAEEFGGELKTSVVLLSAEKAYPQKVVSINPYEIQIEVTKDTPVGEYEVCVTNDGERWNKSVDIDRGKIFVKEEVYDPYGLDQPWADEFVWDNKIDITAAPYNADKTGATDNTQIIQQAIYDAGAAGGGVIYFPEGTYKFGPLKMSARVVLMGDGMEKSKLVYEYHGSDASQVQMIGMDTSAKTHGKVGFLNLSFTVGNNTLYPDTFFWLGEDWGTNITYGSQKTAEHIFLKGCKLVTSMFDTDADGRGLACVIVAKGHTLYENNIFYGHNISPTSNWSGCYSHFVNNYIVSSVGNVSIAASYAVFEDNVIIRNGDLSVDQATLVQGIFMRGYSYVHRNIIRNTGKGNKNDGELVCTEQYRGSSRISGHIVSAGSDYAVVDHYVDASGKTLGHENNEWVMDTAWGNTLEIIITAGKGLGQRKTLESLDESTRRITLVEEWDIIPDETSMFMISPASYATTVYNNYANSGRKGIWLYGDCLDCVVAENHIVDAEGIFSYTCYIVDDTKARINASYFNRFYKNLTEGFSPHGNLCGIGVNAGVENLDVEHIIVYGTTIKGNTMIGETPVPKYTGLDCTEAPDYNGIYAFVLSRKQLQNSFIVMKSTIIENNSINKFDRGITIGISPMENSRNNVVGNMTESYTLKNNTFSEVELEIDAYNANGLVNLDDVKVTSK